MERHRILHAFGCALAMVTTFAVLPAVAQDDQEAELAKKTLNPVASLISLPLKYDYDGNIGPTDQGDKSVLTIQPVLPFSIGTDWNLISRFGHTVRLVAPQFVSLT
jgi:hypothetical protein